MHAERDMQTVDQSQRADGCECESLRFVLNLILVSRRFEETLILKINLIKIKPKILLFLKNIRSLQYMCSKKLMFNLASSVHASRP